MTTKFRIMSQQGAVLQGYNNELVKCVEDLINKRAELHKQILVEEEEMRKLQHDFRILADSLAKVNESITRKLLAQQEYDKTIADTEQAYMKILELSQSLLGVLKKEAQNLGKPEQQNAQAK